MQHQLGHHGFVSAESTTTVNEIMVLGGGADHRRAADIDILGRSLRNGLPAATVASTGRD